MVIIARDYQVSVDNWTKGGIPKEEAEIHDRHWRKLQEDLSYISRDSTFVVATGSDHMIHRDKMSVILEALQSDV